MPTQLRSRTCSCVNVCVVRHVLRTMVWVWAASAQRRPPSLPSFDHPAPALHAPSPAHPMLLPPSARGLPRPLSSSTPCLHTHCCAQTSTHALLTPIAASSALALVTPSSPSSPSRRTLHARARQPRARPRHSYASSRLKYRYVSILVFILYIDYTVL